MAEQSHRKLVILSFVSLDGIMQAPGGPDEDSSGGFKFGGWTVPYFDEAGGQEMSQQMSQPFDLLLGRTTYDIWADHWPQQDETAFGAAVINNATKYVVTSKPLTIDWQKTVPISGDVAAQIAQLKQQHGPTLQVHGSGQLIQLLLEHDLADELWIKTFPVILGKGKRLFGETVAPGAFNLTHSLITPSGVIVANYQRNGAVRTGSFA